MWDTDLYKENTENVKWGNICQLKLEVTFKSKFLKYFSPQIKQHLICGK